MIIEIPKISPNGSQFVGEESASILELENDGHLRVGSPVRYDLTAHVVSQRLVVQGRIEVSIDLTCSRCADFFSTTVADSSFLRAYDVAEGTEQVDITGDLREGILLQMPHSPLCRTDCRGLCSHCGKNLNNGSCTCRTPSWGGAWDDLNELKL